MAAIDLVDMFRRELELCRVKPGEVLAVLTGPASRADYAAAFLAAGQQLGAEVFQLHLPVSPKYEAPTSAAGAIWGKTPLTGHQSGIKMLQQADILIDLMLLLHSPEQLAIQQAGTRVLMVAEPPEVLARLFPRPSLRPRVEAGAERIARARELRVTNAAGTDVLYKLGQYPPILQYGYTDQPGRWDHMAGGFVYTWPNEGQTNGTIVLQPGDIIYPFKDYVRSEVRFTIKDGYITKIEGGFDAQLTKDFLDSFNDPEAYAIAHVGPGLDEMALWSAAVLYNKESVIGMDGRAFYGNVLWSTGPNTDVGGSRNTLAHLDIVMKNASLFLDGEPIVLNGDIIPADMRVEHRQPVSV